MSAFTASFSLDTESDLLSSYEHHRRDGRGLVTMTDKEYEKICLVKDRSRTLSYLFAGGLTVSGAASVLAVGAGVLAGATASLPLAGLLGMAICFGLVETVSSNFRAACLMVGSKQRPVNSIFGLDKIEGKELERRAPKAPAPAAAAASAGPTA